MQVRIIIGAQAIKGAIANIKMNGKAIDAAIQEVGCSVLQHAAAHGDTTLADKLVQALPAGSRKKALVEWMLAFGQMRLLDKANPDEALRIGKGAIFKHDSTRTLALELAMQKEWYKFKPEGSVMDSFDAQAAVKSVLTRLTNAASKGLHIKGKEEAIAEVEALLAALKA